MHHNLTYDEIAEHEARKNEGAWASSGCFAVDTGKFTGRSPGDKWLVKGGDSADKLWWGNINQPIDDAVFTDLCVLPGLLPSYSHRMRCAAP